QLEAALGDGLPVVRGDALADDAPRHRHELIIDVGDPRLIDLGADPPDQLVAAFHLSIRLEISHRIVPWLGLEEQDTPASSRGRGCERPDAACPGRSARTGRAPG